MPSGGRRLLSQGVGQTGGPSVGPFDGRFDKGGAKRHLYELRITSRCKDINVKDEKFAELDQVELPLFF